MESKTVLDSGSHPSIPDSRYWISDSLSLKLGFRNPVSSEILDSLICIPPSKAQDSRIHKQKFPGIWIPLYGGSPHVKENPRQSWILDSGF